MRICLLILITSASTACRAAPADSPAPPPPVRAAPVVWAPDVAADAGVPIAICVFRDGRLTHVAATFRARSGDTLVDGRPFAEVHPTTAPPYAAAAEWFVRREPVPVGTGAYAAKLQYGPERTIEPHELQLAGEYRGLPMFAEAGTTGTPAVVYFLVRPGCIFQPYQAAYTVGPVRG